MNEKSISSEAFLLTGLKDLLENANVNLVSNGIPRWNVDRFSDLNKYMYLRSILADQDSIDLYDRLLRRLFSLSFMSNEKAREVYSVNGKDYWTKVQELKKTVSLPVLDKFDDGLDNTITREAFIQDAYAYKDICRIQTGDIVLDCGAYTGVSAIAFADKTGIDGHIYSFEPFPDTFEKASNNITKYGLNHIVTLINKGLADGAGKLNFAYNPNQSGSAHIHSDGKYEVEITTIDLFAANENLPRVDFIKMDIEGSECAALRGAENVIKKYRPKMAVCIYHKYDDHWNVPEIILSYDKNYKFYLRHHTEGDTETVLYCVPCATEAANYGSTHGEGIYSVIGELYKTTQSQLRKRTNTIFFNKISHFLRNRDFNLNWEVSENFLASICPISNGRRNFLRIAIHNDKICVEIILDEVKCYSDDVKEKVRSLLKRIADKYSDFIVNPNSGNFSGGFSLPYRKDEDLSQKAGQLVLRIIRGCFSELSDMGLLSVELDGSQWIERELGRRG